jgi:Mg-chelatase subunit ChlD
LGRGGWFRLCGLVLLLAGPARAARERTGSVDVFIVLDESGSMKPIFEKVTAFVGESLVRDYLEPGDYLCLIGFSDRPRIRVSQRLSSAEEKENLAEIVGRLNVVPQGYTDMGRALEETLRQLERLAHPAHQQIVLILTDGVNQPQRDSPYYFPVRADAGGGLAPPSDFNDRFLAQVERLRRQGFRTHVVGIGTDTDARKLGETLGADYTLLRAFSAAELSGALARFWDETINLLGLVLPRKPYPPGAELVLEARLHSTSAQPREVHLAGAKLASLRPLLAGPAGPPLPEPGALPVRLAGNPWAAPPRGEASFEVRVTLPEDFPAGDFEATVSFDQQSAVKFYPPEGSFQFHVPSFWERHGARVAALGGATLFSVVAGFLYRRRPIPVVLQIDGQPGAGSSKPFRFRIGGACSFGGGASDRFRLPGLPQKVAVLERRSVERFALMSSQPELVPNLPEYSLGDAIEVRTGEGQSERKQVRFVRAGKRLRRPPRREPVSAARGRPPAGGVDFR